MFCARHAALRTVVRSTNHMRQPTFRSTLRAAGSASTASLHSTAPITLWTLTRWFNAGTTRATTAEEADEHKITKAKTTTVTTSETPPSIIDTDHTRTITVTSLPPLRVCIVGSGPAAFYTAKYLLKDWPSVHIDIIERLPVPFGLVRFGVAPDHPETKNVQHEFTRILTDDRVQFYGNVTIGEHLSLDQLQSYYHVIVLAYGAQSERSLKIPGSHLAGIIPARVLVNWYNGHPAYSHHTFDLQRVQQVVIIGQGNVAIDCARMLLSPSSVLQQTDIADHALQTLASSHVTEVHLLGRRGPVQSAFTTAEFREVSKMADVVLNISDHDLKEGEEGENAKELATSREKMRKMQLIKQVAQRSSASAVASALASASASSKTLSLHFFSAPVEYIEDLERPGHVAAVKVERMLLQGVADELKASGTGIYSILPAQLVLESIGYRSEPLHQSLPFDEQHHIIPSSSGRVSDGTGIYVCGWLKRGPTGIIGRNIPDARETVNSIITDMTGIHRDRLSSDTHYSSFMALLHSHVPHHRVVDKVGWERINAWELERGVEQLRPRVKIVKWEDMLNVAGV